MQTNPFVNLSPSPSEHFKLLIYSAVLHIIDHVIQLHGSCEAVFEKYPFLIGYNNELAENGLQGLPASEAEAHWREWLASWEKSAFDYLPIRTLQETMALDYDTMMLLFTIGLIEEESQFGLLFELLQNTPGQRRPTVSLLYSLWQSSVNDFDLRLSIRKLKEIGLLQIRNPEMPMSEWILQVPTLIWQIFRGEQTGPIEAGIHYRCPNELAVFDELILPEDLKKSLVNIPKLLANGDVHTLIVRGPRHNSRRTLAGAIARLLDRGMIEIEELNKTDKEKSKLIGLLATLLHGIPIFVYDLAPAETLELPQLNNYDGPIVVVLGKQGGVSGPGVERAITLTLEMPDINTRHCHWQRVMKTHTVAELAQISNRFRMTSGNIYRAAELALAYTTLAGHDHLTFEDVKQAIRALDRQMLDTLATRVNTEGDWRQIAVNEVTLSELQNLDCRCRHRELLQQRVSPVLGSRLNAGVRALFTGPSGTGKTLAAQLLASVLQMDLYRLDLSAVVNKYIGETEKNLNQIFSRTEELDVILLIDEGDALFTQRTSVQTSNDRYANLETNFLLQRIESYEGILIITTNASANIDTAFQRRMDVVIEFHPPESSERWVIWQMHLPANHLILNSLLNEIAQRCVLNGGQIRNAVLQASLLALADGGTVTSAHLVSAVKREYRKIGAVFPLRAESFN